MPPSINQSRIHQRSINAHPHAIQFDERHDYRGECIYFNSSSNKPNRTYAGAIREKLFFFQEQRPQVQNNTQGFNTSVNTEQHRHVNQFHYPHATYPESEDGDARNVRTWPAVTAPKTSIPAGSPSPERATTRSRELDGSGRDRSGGREGGRGSRRAFGER